VESLCCKIECLRQRMHVTALEKGISHSEVLLISCRLDELLNDFYKVHLMGKFIDSVNFSRSPHRCKLRLCTTDRKYRKYRKYRNSTMARQAAVNG